MITSAVGRLERRGGVEHVGRRCRRRPSPWPHSTHHSPGTATHSSWLATRSVVALARVLPFRPGGDVPGDGVDRARRPAAPAPTDDTVPSHLRFSRVAATVALAHRRCCACNSAEKNSSAVFVLVCWSPVELDALALEERAGLVGDIERLRRAGTSSTARRRGCRRGTSTSRRRAAARTCPAAIFSLRTKIGPSTERSSRPRPSGAWASKNARCSLENSWRSGLSPDTDGAYGRRRQLSLHRPGAHVARRASRRPRRRSSATGARSAGS